VKIYLFTSDFKLIRQLEKIGIDGVLYTYNTFQPNHFITIPKNISNTKIKHMVAVRPYTMSPQMLVQIAKTFDLLYGEGMIQINLVSGWIKENEKDAGGILGSVSDYSERIDKSKYLQEYIHALESLEYSTLDYYVSITNNFTFETASKYNKKMIIPYDHFEKNKYDFKNQNIMVFFDNHPKDGSPLAHEELFNMMKMLELKGVEEVIFPGGEQDFMDHMVDFIKKYRALPEITMVN
jgi:hypothetical protein